MAKAKRRLSRSVKRVDDAHFDQSGSIFLHIKLAEGGSLTLAMSAADLRYIAGFGARQIVRRNSVAKYPRGITAE